MLRGVRVLWCGVCDEWTAKKRKRKTIGKQEEEDGKWRGRRVASGVAE